MDEHFKSVDKNYWDNMIKEVDKNGDGEVNFLIKKRKTLQKLFKKK